LKANGEEIAGDNFEKAGSELHPGMSSFLCSALPLYAAMLVSGLVLEDTQMFTLKTSPEAMLAPVSAVQVYTRQFTCTSVQLLQAMCVCYNWAKKSEFALPSTALR
jgi:hypothetical protein